MNNSLKKIQAWWSRKQRRREQRELKRWERLRAHGKTRFVLGAALVYGLTVAGTLDVIDNVFNDGAKISTLLYHVVLYPVIGIGLAHVHWWDMEAKYKNALIEARVKASPSGKLPPHDSPTQITADSESK